ncbi:MAG: SdrD B-like domain-containing protein [Pseudomonadota bacterium]
MSERNHIQIRPALGALLLCLSTGLLSSDDLRHPVHRVAPAESLWRIADRYLGSPYRWRELWRLNPQVQIPELIYPGDLIRLPAAVANAAAIDQRSDVPAPSANPTAGAAIALERETETVAVAAPPPLGQTTAQRVALPAAGTARELERPSSAPRGTTRVPGTAATPSGFRALKVPAAPTVPSDSGYVDRLIDPSTPDDTYADYGRPSRGNGIFDAIDHAVDVLTLYRDDDVNFESSLDYGFQYVARASTRNWGELRLNLIALDEFGSFSGSQGPDNGLFQQQSGIARFSIEQTNLPLTERLTMDNIVGMHRQRRYNPFRERPNLINYRFSAAEPDIRGLSSQLKFGNSGIGFSVGDLGQTRGTLLPGFLATEGRIQRGQFTHVLDRHALSADVWQTQDQTRLDNRRGYRVAYDRLLGANTVLSMSGVASGSQHALLLGGTTGSSLTRHDYGAYYFEPDIIWLDNRIGDDNAGAFYRLNTQQGPRTLGASIELRRDGLQADSGFRADTAFVNLSMAQRLTRKSALSTVYGYRQVDVTSGSQRSFREHTLRSYLTHAHGSDTRSNLGVLTRLRSQEQELEISYGWARNMHDSSSLELATRFRHQFASTDAADEVALNASWQKQFSHGTSLGLGLGYAYGDSRLARSRGITGFLNLEHPLTNRLGLSLQLDYSVDQADYEDANLADTLFTNDALLDDNLEGVRTVSALLKLSYQLNGRTQPTIIRGSGIARGAGRIQGIVFVDANGDGRRQPDERGVPGITLFLNSVHPIVTDARGTYSFPSVSPGQHFVFLDETTLPLPWTLANGEYTGLEVHLRRTTTVDIPLSTITLAEAQ